MATIPLVFMLQHAGPPLCGFYRIAPRFIILLRG
jgi:hypothetical protein